MESCVTFAPVPSVKIRPHSHSIHYLGWSKIVNRICSVFRGSRIYSGRRRDFLSSFLFIIISFLVAWPRKPAGDHSTPWRSRILGNFSIFVCHNSPSADNNLLFIPLSLSILYGYIELFTTRMRAFAQGRWTHTRIAIANLIKLHRPH